MDDDRALPSADPWARFGWVMGAVWIVFLIFPISEVAQSAEGPGEKALALAGIGVFAAVYVTGFIVLPRLHDGARGHRLGTVFLAVLVLLAAALAIELGAHVIGMVPFLVAFGIFNQPAPRGLVLAGGWFGLSLILLLTTGMLGEYWFLLLIILLVIALTGMVHWIEGRQDRHLTLERELNLVAERERVARDVHDVLGHSLTVVTVKTELARRLVDVDPEAAKAELVQIESMTREALAEVRATVAGLRVTRLGDELLGARAALTEAGIEAEVPTDPDVVDPRHRLVLAWVLREAVTNVVRHSGAAHCLVELRANGLVVTDDGRGPGTGLGNGGNGLRGARERVDGAGGTLTVETAEGGGTRVEVAW